VHLLENLWKAVLSSSELIVLGMKISSLSIWFFCCCVFLLCCLSQLPSAAPLLSLDGTVMQVDFDNAQGSRGRVLDDLDEGKAVKYQENNSADAGGYTVLIVVLVLTSV